MKLFDNVVILFDPSFNPDGMQRFSTWVNQHKSKNIVADSNSREFKEVWPGGRSIITGLILTVIGYRQCM
jgi:hypothetical protein